MPTPMTTIKKTATYKKSDMKSIKDIRNAILKPISQAYANVIISILSSNIDGDTYEYFMSQAVILDYVCSEELGFDLD